MPSLGPWRIFLCVCPSGPHPQTPRQDFRARRRAPRGSGWLGCRALASESCLAPGLAGDRSSTLLAHLWVVLGVWELKGPLLSKQSCLEWSVAGSVSPPCPAPVPQVYQLGGICKLVELLRSPNQNVQQAAAGALRNLVFRSTTNKLETRRQNGIREAVSLLGRTRSTEIQKQLTGGCPAPEWVAQDGPRTRRGQGARAHRAGSASGGHPGTPMGCR